MYTAVATARHNVTPNDIEQVFSNDPMDLDAGVVDGNGTPEWATRIGYACWF